MKKLLCLMLVVLLCAAMFAACTDNGDTDESKADQSTPTQSENSENQSKEVSDTSNPDDDPYLGQDGIYRITNQIIDWEEREFAVIVRGVGAGTYQSDDFTTGSELYGDTLDNAVTQRNQVIEEKYNVKIKVYKSDLTGSDPILSNIRSAIESGLNTYDAVMPAIPGLTVLALEGGLYDLTQFDYINLDAPWYDKDANETFSIGNKLFFTTGDITILNKVCSISMLFNKQLIETYGLDNPYDLVKEHKWTYDKVIQMAKAVTKDTDGEAGMSTKDTWGMLAAHMDALNFYGAAGQKLCLKDSDDFPYLAFGDETTFTIAQKIINDMIEAGTWVVYAQDFEDPIWVTSLDAFKEGRILFRPSGFSATTKLRLAGTDFGIVPMPLWNENQDEYYTYCGTGEVAGVAIPACAADPEFSAYMIEAISCESKNYITPAYVEINLKGKDVQDDESLEMLNIIFANITYDTGEIYRFGGINTLFADLVKNKQNTLRSEYDSRLNKIEDAIDELIDSYLSQN